MNILLAPNAMKGALSAQKIASILQNTLHRKFPQATITPVPIADGGNGTLDCLMNELGGTIYEHEVMGPVPSMNVTARFGITKNNIGIIESAEAIGLHLLDPSPETMAQSTSHGVGELVKELVNRHCSELWIGLGGTATNDGGAGMARALGSCLLDESGVVVKEGAMNLLQLHKITNDELRIKKINIKVLSDVRNNLLGEHGATYTFARQKGASEEQLPYLEAAVKNFADTAETSLGKQFRHIPGSGAAGGLGFGLLAFCNAQIVPGIDFILNAVSFDKKLKTCDFVITSEGILDEQTLYGKGIAGIAEHAAKYNKPVHAFVGKINGEREALQEKLGLASITQISPNEMTTAEAIRDASWLLADAVFHCKF